MSLKRDPLSLRSTQEQLRADHIETLELLQQFKTENARLKKELKRTCATTVVQETDSSDGSPQQEETEIDVLQLIEQNSKQSEEIKLLKMRINQTDVELLKMKQASASAHQSGAHIANEKLKKMELDMTNTLLELEEKLRTATANQESMVQLQDKCNELEIRNAELARECNENEIRAHSSSSITEEIESKLKCALAEISELKRENSELKLRYFTEQELTMSIHNSEIAMLRAENERLNEESTTCAQKRASLEATIIVLRAECCTQKSTIDALHHSKKEAPLLDQRDVQNDLVFRDSDSDSEKGKGQTSAAALAPMEIPEQSACSSPPSEPEPALLAATSSTTSTTTTTLATGDAEGSFRFQEYLRLKRENKELKLRLADISHSSANGGGSNGVLASLGALSPCSSTGGSFFPKDGGMPLTSRSSTGLAPLISPRLISNNSSARSSSRGNGSSFGNNLSSSISPNAGSIGSIGIAGAGRPSSTVLRNRTTQKFF